MVLWAQVEQLDSFSSFSRGANAARQTMQLGRIKICTCAGCRGKQEKGCAPHNAGALLAVIASTL